MKTREIKFRAWNGREMVYSHNNDLNTNEFQLGWFFQKLDNELSRLNIAHELMQFTGLRDKNGKEIFEGDILGGYPNGTVFVRWNNQFACFESVSHHDIVNEAGEDSHEEIASWLANDLEDCKDSWEVIGNLYETPELLNQ